MKKRKMLTKAQLLKIEKVIRKRFRAFSLKTLGKRALTDEEIAELKSSGLLPSHVREFIADAHAIGKIAATLGPATARTLTYEQVLEMAKKFKKTTGVEEKAIQYATDHAGQYIKGIEDDMVKDVVLAATKTSMEVLRQNVSSAIKDRITQSQLKSNLYHAIDNRGRDWQRIATTEMQNSIQQGIYNELRDSSEDGDNQLCYKRPSPSACKHCKRVYLKSDGTPKIFRLRDLETSNVGKKAMDWKPTIEAVHPWCQCQLHILPKGYGFEKKPVAAEEFEIDGKTYKRGSIIDEDVYAKMTTEQKKKTRMDAIQTFTGEEEEPVSKAEINLPFSDEDECVCEY
jgi:hypothetical protein